MSVRARAAAPDCVECPDVYVGKFGVPIYGDQVVLMFCLM
jgi:hypothetical protein